MNPSQTVYPSAHERRARQDGRPARKAREGLIARKLREARSATPVEKTGSPRVIDLSELAHAPSSELAFLLEVLPHLQAGGVPVAVTGLQANVRRIFELTHLNRLFPIVP